MSTLMNSIKELSESNNELREEIKMISPMDGKFMEGNAIFTDIEEQRLALEKELITLKV